MKEFQEEEGQIVIYGAREHNLKNIDLTIPRNSVPASVLDLPTVRIAFSKSIQSHFILRISIDLSPQHNIVSTIVPA